MGALILKSFIWGRFEYPLSFEVEYPTKYSIIVITTALYSGTQKKLTLRKEVIDERV